MVNWETTVKLDDLHELFKAKEITIQEVARGLAARLKANKYAEDLDDEIMELEDLAEATLNECTEDLVEWYDTLLNSIYSFGDWDHRIWIKTC